ncbi:hypothetical protein HK104_000738 [Borealophlyctis nickersoniae]|nr:hypothetical protein HK104_000738 [Borealophlyctis nickersoniae]
MVGSFSFTWKLLNNLLFHFHGRQSRWNGAIAGGVAGLAVLFEDPDMRMSIAQQMCIRGFQAGYNVLKSRDLIKFTHGDTAMFMLACGSIMYAYIMQPSTIPREYYSWMVKTARMPDPALHLNRTHVRALESNTTPPDLTAIFDTITKLHGTQAAKDRATADFNTFDGVMPAIPCSVLHPNAESCTKYNVALFAKVFWGIAPVYAALNLVPMLLLKAPSVMKSPIPYFRRALLGTARSSTFLSTFVVIYMTGICIVRNVLFNPILSKRYGLHDHKAIYYILGMLCSSSILIEPKPRRAELAMYVLPKGLQSAWEVLYNRGRMVKVPFFDVWMACGGMALLMSVYQTEPERMSSLLFKFMEKVLGRY